MAKKTKAQEDEEVRIRNQKMVIDYWKTKDDNDKVIAMLKGKKVPGWKGKTSQ